VADSKAPAPGKRFSGTGVIVAVGVFSLLMGGIVIALSQRSVDEAMDERSAAPAELESPAELEAAAQNVAATDAPPVLPVADDEPGWWRCSLPLHDHNDMGVDWDEITFAMWLPPEGDARPAYIRNGEEFIEAQSRWDGERLEILFPHYDSKIDAEVVGDGPEADTLSGVWWKQRRGELTTMHFSARRVDHFDECHPAPGMEYPGVIGAERQWSAPRTHRMVFDSSGLAKGVFESAKVGPIRHGKPTPGEDGLHRWRGTIMTPTGDYRYLYGTKEIEGDSMNGYLTVFDGAHAFLFTFVNDEQGGLAGVFHSGAHWEEDFTATRLGPGEDYKLPDPFSAVSLVPGETRLNLPMLDEAPYAGNPVIVHVMGTWCPNCHDSARLLAELYDAHHGEGLQILGLAYEHSTDEERSARQIERFKERHGAEWSIVQAGISDKSQTASTLPALTDIKSYPTTIFLNRDHTVEAIHSGFSGPATGAAHEKTREEFTRLVEAILGS